MKETFFIHAVSGVTHFGWIVEKFNETSKISELNYAKL